MLPEACLSELATSVGVQAGQSSVDGQALVSGGLSSAQLSALRAATVVELSMQATLRVWVDSAAPHISGQLAGDQGPSRQLNVPHDVVPPPRRSPAARSSEGLHGTHAKPSTRWFAAHCQQQTSLLGVVCASTDAGPYSLPVSQLLKAFPNWSTRAHVLSMHCCVVLMWNCTLVHE